MNATIKTIALSVVVTAFSACKKGDSAELPPARGENAPELPALPKIPKDGAEEAGVVPTEGRTTGTTFPKQEAQIGPNMGGVISAIAVEEGARVKKGQLLFQQDPRDSELRVAQAKTAHAAAEVNLRAMTTEYERAKVLFEQNAMNRAQWDQMQAKFDGAKIGVEQASVALEMAKKALTDMAVRAPFDGVVTSKLKSVGEMATMMPPSIVLILQQHSLLELKFRLPEHALTKVKAGDHITATFRSIGVTKTAKISRVQAGVDRMTRTVELVAEIPNEDFSLRPGLLAEVKLDETVAAQETAP